MVHIGASRQFAASTLTIRQEVIRNSTPKARHISSDTAVAYREAKKLPKMLKKEVKACTTLALE